jgi:hypothetical protein
MQSVVWLALSGFLGVCTFFAAQGSINHEPAEAVEESRIQVAGKDDEGVDLNSQAAIRFRQQQSRHWRHILIKR